MNSPQNVNDIKTLFQFAPDLVIVAAGFGAEKSDPQVSHSEHYRIKINVHL
jgi:acetoin utilization deacetylase AcuC-like enzyme